MTSGLTADDLPLLVSVHLPKTAGTSFRAALQAHYGNKLLEDYAMLPMQVPRGRREWQSLRDAYNARDQITPSTRAIHGHFLPVKYRLALRQRQTRYITWLRDPVDRLVSHYHYWRRDYAGDDPRQPLRNRMIGERWSLERFCLGSELRNLYRQYLWFFPVERFAFIGITEHYAQDLDWFARHLLRTSAPEVEHALANPDHLAGVYEVDLTLRQRIEAHHDVDVALYRQALGQRHARLATIPS
jgi:hypothetical protein